MMAKASTLFEFDESREFARWSVAAAVVLAAHLGLAASYLLLRNVHPDGVLPAPVVIIDLAPVPVAPSSEHDIAVGPQMVEALAPPEPTPQVQPDQLTPPPSLENSVVATPEPTPRPQPKLESKPPAPRTSATPRSPIHTGNIAAAPAPGSTSAHSFPPSWINLLFSHLLRYRQYPSSAQANRQEGVVTLTFSMDRNGRVLARSIAHSSGVPALDAEALAMIERAQPLPPFPPNMSEAVRSFTAPIKFSLR
jgi:protein TonB